MSTKPSWALSPNTRKVVYFLLTIAILAVVAYFLVDSKAVGYSFRYDGWGMIGTVIGVLLLIALIFWLTSRSNKQKARDAETRNALNEAAAKNRQL